MDPNARLDRFVRGAWIGFGITVLLVPGAAVLQLLGVI